MPNTSVELYERFARFHDMFKSVHDPAGLNVAASSLYHPSKPSKKADGALLAEVATGQGGKLK